MAKRTATTELNHDNWNDEDTPEEPGTFVKASSDVLEKRVLRTAKRRVTNPGEPGKSAFSSFSGFKTTGNTNAASQFSFLSNFNSTNATKPSTTTNGSQSTSENGTTEVKTPAVSPFLKDSTVKSSPEKATSQKSPKKSSPFYAKLKGLNEGVSQWIKKHVDANPYCILTPIFKDYEKYLKEFESLKPADEKEPASEAPKSPVKVAEPVTKPPETSIFSNVKTTTSNTDSWKPDKAVFANTTSSNNKSIFGNSDPPKTEHLFTSSDKDNNPFFKKNNNATSSDDNSGSKSSGVFPVNAVNPATFSFGQSSVDSGSAGFSFGSGKPFTFGAQAVKPTAETSEKAEDEDKNEDDEPPKPDFKPVTEEGSIYEQRCKVYYKKDDQYSDRGVGMLFLKPTPNDKMQLIVRAVNSLGNLLVNTFLTRSMPIKRQKDNMIMLGCVPMPDAESTFILLRVKTKEDGDQLLENLQKHAK